MMSISELSYVPKRSQGIHYWNKERNPHQAGSTLPAQKGVNLVRLPRSAHSISFLLVSR